MILSTEFPPGPGGIGTQAHQLAGHLALLEWEVLVVTPQDYADDAAIEDFNRRRAFRVVRLPPVPPALAQSLRRAVVADRCLRQHKPQVVLATGDRAAYLAAALCGFHRIPWLAVEHGRAPRGWERLVKRWAFGRANGVVAVSRYSLARLERLGVRPRAAHVIPNGADAERFVPRSQEEARKRVGFGGGRLILTVGHVSERKGQDLVIGALPEVLRQAPDTHYWMAGLPAKAPEFLKLAESLGVAGHVRVLGAVDTETLVDLYNACDILAVTSRETEEQFEGFGIVVIEAALCGRPGVVSRHSGLEEAVVDWTTGLTVAADDHAATSGALLALLDDAERRARMGTAARQRALEGYTWAHRAREYEERLSGLAS